MLDIYMIDRAKAHLKMARYLLSKADERGTTHGEKHHFIFVCLAEIASALYNLSNDPLSPVDRYENTDPTEIGEIPF